VPDLFSPSQLAFGESCLLRAVLGSVPDAPKLTAHPAAVLGRVLHELIDMAVRGQIDPTPDPKRAVEQMLDVLLDREEGRLSAVRLSDPLRLRDVFPPLVWRRKRRAALDLAEKYLSGVLPRAIGRGGGRPLDAREFPPNGRWAEVRLQTPSLRLHGRADIIERTNGNVTVRDLKTGRVLGSDGDLLPHIERQMRLYGAMAHVVWPTASVSLVVDYGIERGVEFTAAQESELVVWLNDILRRLPSDADASVDALASPGEVCDGCPHRHVCPAYLRTAPDLWRGKAVARMPLDVWGEVIAVSTRSSGLVDLTIRDAIGRSVKIFGLATFRLDNVQLGDAVWFFGLRSRDRRGGEGSWKHPHNFFEVADDDEYSRAWALEAFRS